MEDSSGLDTRGQSSNRVKDELDAEASYEPAGATDDVPDGGLAAWMVVFGAWCTSFCSYGWINSKRSSCSLVYLHTNAKALGIGVFQDYYEHNMLKGYSTSAIAWVPSLQIFFVMGSVCQR